jgi:hypothetical protein
VRVHLLLRQVLPEQFAVNWSHPAFANRHMIARNDKEIIRYSMAME